MISLRIPALLALCAAGKSPDVELFDNYNNALNVIVPKGTSNGGTVKYLGNFESLDKCQSACIGSTEERCWHFVQLKSGDQSAGDCYAVVSPGFNPSYDETAITGSVHWDCRNDEDCSLNGKCQVNGACRCRAAWKGRRCETLNVLPPSRSSGYRGTDDGHNTSSWGGAVLKDDAGTYHMWASEMTEHCGIGAWVQNSRIIHATSSSPAGASVTFDDGATVKFTRVERPHLIFAGRQLRGDPIHITNSAQYGMGTDPGSGAMNDDACFTLVMPIAHAVDEDVITV